MSPSADSTNLIDGRWCPGRAGSSYERFPRAFEFYTMSKTVALRPGID